MSKRFRIVKLGECEEEYFVDCEQEIIDYDDYVGVGTFATMSNQQVADLLNEQQATIEMYQRKVHKREEQISIIKKHCLKFLTNEQVETIRKELDSTLRVIRNE